MLEEKLKYYANISVLACSAEMADITVAAQRPESHGDFPDIYIVNSILHVLNNLCKQYAQLESDQHIQLRRLVFYPLNYGRAT